MDARLALLPADIPPERVAAVLGLISDTHLPERLDRLPDGVLAALAGVDLLLHAGDLGELALLDRLGAIAPLVAVHGNDDTPESQRELPFQQLLVVAGRRILLSHGHRPLLADELASRVDDAVEPKLAGLAARAGALGARLFLFGHWHVPMALERAGVFLVNAGALASPSYVTRQSVRTVARLFLLDDGRLRVVHVDLASPDRAFAPPTDPAIGFRANAVRYAESILVPGLEDELAALRAGLPVEARGGFNRALLRAGRPVWHGQRPRVEREALRAELRAEGLDLPG